MNQNGGEQVHENRSEIGAEGHSLGGGPDRGQIPARPGGAAPPERIYIACDDHTDYYWSGDAAIYRPAFLEMLDYYLDRVDATAEQPDDTLKELLRLTTIPEDQTKFERELGVIIDWYNEHRPHETFRGQTPNEVHSSRPAANQQPRFEPRRKWPRGLGRQPRTGCSKRRRSHGRQTVKGPCEPQTLERLAATSASQRCPKGFDS